MKPSISVIIPSYNRRHTLGRALDSVLAQTDPADEVIVVDDGSSDGTDEFIASHYPDIIYLQQGNRGVSAARNKGILAAHSEWIALLDSDDEWLPEKLARQRQAIVHNSGYRIVHCDELWIRKGRRVNPMHKHEKNGGWIFEHCLPLCAISPSAVVLEKTLLEELNLFDESLPACEDYDLWLKICARYPVFYLDEPLLRKYGGHEDQLSKQHWGMDRFRVRALQGILAADVLSKKQYQAAKSMLLKKCDILAQGARKRGNTSLLATLDNIVAQYSQQPESQ